MKENSIEETIKQLRLILKVRKEQKEIIECAGGSCINCNPDIEALTNSINILSDYKRVLKENETLKAFMKSIFDEDIEKEFIRVQKVKDKIEELEKWIYTGKNAPQDFLQYRIKAKIQVLQDLIEGRK